MIQPQPFFFRAIASLHSGEYQLGPGERRIKLSQVGQHDQAKLLDGFSPVGPAAIPPRLSGIAGAQRFSQLPDGDEILSFIARISLQSREISSLNKAHQPAPANPRIARPPTDGLLIGLGGLFRMAARLEVSK